MKKFSFLLLATLMLGFANPFTMGEVNSSSNEDVLSSANADFETILVPTDGDEDDLTEVTSEADKNDEEDFEIYPSEEEGTYFYLGMKTLFDAAYFDVRGTTQMDDDDEDEDAELTWQYSDGDSWSDLDVEEDTLEGFGQLGVKRVEFDLPSDWDQSTVEGEDLYWVRVRLDDDIEQSPVVEQISARAYNLEVTVKNEENDRLRELSEENFSVGNGSVNSIYAFRNLGEGHYQLGLQSEDVDNEYTLVVEVSGYLDHGSSVPEVSNDLTEVTVKLSFESGCDNPYTDVDYHWAQSAIRELYCRDVVDIEGSRFGVNNKVTRTEFLKMALLDAEIDTNKYDERTVPYEDVDEDEWYYEYVAAAYALDYLDEDEKYYPEGAIDRAEAVTLLIRMAGVETDETSTSYRDVSSSDWYAAAIRAATDHEVVEGYPDRSFKPENNLTRAEAAVMVNNAFYAWFN